MASDGDEQRSCETHAERPRSSGGAWPRASVALRWELFLFLRINYPALSRVLNVYKPTGPLSGVSTAAIVMWLAAWAMLHYRWQGRM